MSPQVPKEFLRGLGPRWHLDVQGHRDEVFAFYQPFHQAQLARLGPGAEIIETSRYGSHAKNEFEFYWPESRDDQSLAHEDNP